MFITNLELKDTTINRLRGVFYDLATYYSQIEELQAVGRWTREFSDIDNLLIRLSNDQTQTLYKSSKLLSLSWRMDFRATVAQIGRPLCVQYGLAAFAGLISFDVKERTMRIVGQSSISLVSSHDDVLLRLDG